MEGGSSRGQMLVELELMEALDKSPANKRIRSEDLDSIDASSEPFVLDSRLCLDGVGRVELVLDHNGLHWHTTENTQGSDKNISSCWGLATGTKMPTELLLSKIYATELVDRGPIHESKSSTTNCLLGLNSKMHRFVVHTFEKTNKQYSIWVPKAIVFGHSNLETCQLWVQRIDNFLKLDVRRPKKLLVFVNPKSGKGNAGKAWEIVASLFDRAKISTKVVKTKRAGHAFDVMNTISNEELNYYDGIVVVGGDGFFNEVLNGLLSWRHKAPYPPTPADIQHYFQDDVSHPRGSNLNHPEVGIEAVQAAKGQSELDSVPSCPCKESLPLLQSSVASQAESSHSSISTPTQEHAVTHNILGSHIREAKATSLLGLQNPWFRIGIIPAGSTDTIVISTTGARDPITSALHIILGQRTPLDIAQIVSWKSSAKSSEETPRVRYAASFAGYGFYGDVIKESELYRWMGPARYDYAGTRVFMRHRSYEAEVAFAEVPDKITLTSASSEQPGGRNEAVGNSKKAICRVNCSVCAEGINTDESILYHNEAAVFSQTQSQVPRWSKSKGRFLSVGAAIISCRNDKAPDGVVAHAHLADGFLHLILIRDCPRPAYLWHLLQLTRKGADPLDFKFIEHHKTPVFTFVSHGEESVWNVDGELFGAHKLSAQVFRGLISLFASGPEI